MHKRDKGFTLIELLVVIAIIGILAAIILVSLSTARTKAAWANAKQNASSVATALTLYNDDCGNFPANDVVVFDTANPEPDTLAGGPNCTPSNTVYAGSLPNNTLGTNAITYTYVTDAVRGFILTATQANVAGQNPYVCDQNGCS